MIGAIVLPTDRSLYGRSVDRHPSKLLDIEIMQMIYMIPLVQNRPENWEFHFRRSDYYGCYRSGESTSEGLVPPYDDENLARFPAKNGTPADCE